MGVNDAKEQLEVAIEEFGKLERELAKVEAERDAALAVIEQAKSWNTHDKCDPAFWDLHHILTQAPTDALAKVKADALREAADLLDTSFWTSQGFYLRIEADRIENAYVEAI